MRPIDADALEKMFKTQYGCETCDNYGGIRCRACHCDDALGIIDSAPTLDVQPVRRSGCEYCNGSGRVLYQETHSVKLYLNSFGDARTIEVEANRCPPFADCAMVNVPARSAFIINFCPHCGADMRQEERHE